MTITPNRATWAAPQSATADVVLVTPDIAATWLEANVNNRKLRPHHVAALAADMAAGRWHLSPDAVAFDTSGRLVNGQHRLSAVVKSGAIVEMLVVRNTTSAAYVVTDDGLKRTLGDQLRHLGFANASAVASAVTQVAKWELNGQPMTGGNQRDGELTKQVLIGRFLTEPDAFVAATRAGDRISGTVGLSRTWWAAAMYFFARADTEDASAWETLLTTRCDLDGNPLSQTHPAAALCDAIHRDAILSRPSLKHDRRHALALIVKAWNAYRAGEQVSLLRFRAGGAKPEAFPEVR